MKNRWLMRAADSIRPRVAQQETGDGETDLERLTERRVIDLAMRVAETMLTVGASVNDVTLAALHILKRYGVHPAHVDVTYTSITVSYYRGPREDPLSVTRVIQARTTDYTRLQRLAELTSRIDDGLGLDEARAQFAGISAAPHPYRRAVVTLANGGIAGGVAILLGGQPLIVLAAVFSTILITVLQHSLGKRLLPTFFTQALGALIVTGITMVMTALAKDHGWFGEVRPSIIVAAGIVVMLAGMSVVGAAQDAIDGHYVTAGARGLEVVLLTLGIVIGIAAGLRLGSRVGYGFLLSTSAPSLGSLQEQLVGVTVIAASYAVATYAGARAVLLAAAMGLIGWGFYLLGTWAQLGPAAANGLGALAGSFIAVLISRWLRVPALALTTAAIVPLVPGATIFRGLLQLIDANGAPYDMMNGASTLLAAAGVAVAIAAGVSLGAWFGRPTRDTITMAARRLRRDGAA
ncbi:threonine/serine exporter family protein [Cumulibacter manganitolerans]|uniref:threonine/serine ThrE exporter family protein n=1 Tax=Cumulibacter manganitolerans TaxID=1884992 RepID=UPI0012970680|nr:threonine/serine exporter family protein [Cumulibacter manganitolerans]